MADEKDGEDATEGKTLFSFDTIPPDPKALQAIHDAHLTNAHYAALGRLAAQWAYFEAVVDTWCFKFARVEPETGACFTAQMIGPRPRLDALLALIKHAGAREEWHRPLKQFAERARGIGEQRNRRLHDVWFLDIPAKPERLEITAKGTVSIKAVQEPTTDLEELVKKIDTLTAELDSLAEMIFNENAKAERDALLGKEK